MTLRSFVKTAEIGKLPIPTWARRGSARSAFVALTLTLLVPRSVLAEDWPQFRGPGGQGHSTARNLPLTWSEEKNIAWKVPVAGRGWSSPAIEGDQIWLTSALDDGRSLRAMCFDRRTGRLVHDREVFRLEDAGSIHSKNSHASPTPIIDGRYVYVHFGAHGTACLSRDGQVVWRTQQLKHNHRHGPAGSPILFEELLILSCDGTDVQFVVALDSRTGKIRWRRDRDGLMAFSTPLLLEVDGVPQVISTGGHFAAAYDARNGREIWRLHYGDGYSLIPRPVFGEGLVFICSGFDSAVLYAVRPGGRGDVTDSHVAWSLRRGVPLTSSPLLIGRELYLVNDRGIASCLDARTGRSHWRERIGGGFSASPVVADGRIYMTNEAGVTTVLAPGTVFKKLAANSLDGRTLASPAVAGEAMYIRTEHHLYRIQGTD